MELYGRNYDRRALEERVGRLDQVAGITRVTRADGMEAGVEQLLVRTGSGLSYWLTPSRCLDIGLTEFGGTPLSWLAPAGLPHPAFYDPDGTRWLRTAAGGLLMTCGLTQAGSPCEDQGESLGLHGRIHHQPARLRAVREEWEGDELHYCVEAETRQAALFGEQLMLERRITSQLGENALLLEDTVTNIGFEPAPHMMLYHCNFGFPLIDEHCSLLFPSQKVEPRSPSVPMEGYDQWQRPTAGFEERVYFHSELDADEEHWTSATIEQPAFPMAGGARPVAVSLWWDTTTLPLMIQWKMCGQGAHVLGIEPSNCRVNGRAQARENGELTIIEPGDSLTYRLRLTAEAS